jgi:hypothetical protein
MENLIKICPNPQCEAVWHNIPKTVTKCQDCGGNVKIINEETYWKKYANNYFQYDFESQDYFRLENNLNNKQ